MAACQQRILHWLAAIEPNQTATSSPRPKHKRVSSDDDSSPADLTTPHLSTIHDTIISDARPLNHPPTFPSSHCTPEKKRSDHFDDDDLNDETSKRPHLGSRVMLPLPRKPRSRSTSPIKTQSYLRSLEKPVLIADIDQILDEAEGDASKGLTRSRALYERLLDIDSSIGFIPSNIEDAVRATLRNPRRMTPQWLDNTPDETEEENLLIHEELLEICCRAVRAKNVFSHEAGWNSAVQHRLLDLVFEGRRPSRVAASEKAGSVGVLVENVTFATIAGDCLPRLKQRHVITTADEDARSVAACSLSQSGSSVADSNDNDSVFSSPRNSNIKTQRLDAGVHTKSTSKKIDFALLVDAGKSTPLHTAIASTLDRLLLPQQQQHRQTSPSINPSLYAPLISAPMAVMIETKTASAVDDPLVQLGLMSAAVHRRLHTLPVKRAAGKTPVTNTGMILDLPLITVTDHEWRMYFGCDRGSSIELLGPVRMGATDRIEHIWQLYAACRAVKRWITEEYCPFLEEWLEE